MPAAASIPASDGGWAMVAGCAFPHCWVVEAGGGLRVLDPGSPTDPRFVGLGGNPRGGFDVALDGDLAVAGDD